MLPSPLYRASHFWGSSRRAQPEHLGASSLSSARSVPAKFPKFSFQRMISSGASPSTLLISLLGRDGARTHTRTLPRVSSSRDQSPALRESASRLPLRRGSLRAAGPCDACSNEAGSSEDGDQREAGVEERDGVGDQPSAVICLEGDDEEERGGGGAPADGERDEEGAHPPP